MSGYDHKAVEQKWQAIWAEKHLFRAEVDPNRPKYYILDMFPYPSGAGLHVGHVTGYTATDIVARYKRMKGFNVLHPMGWDSFGLPAEQYAIRTGTHPSITTEKNIDTYRRQLKSLGLSYDWDRELATSDPKYYKWTQWIFTKLYEKGLAYEAEVLVNFCPALGTVLANEEVEHGRSKEGGYPIERRPLRQWVLKITAYADRLIDDLATLDWPDSLKRLQIHWIGKSEGAKVEFEVVSPKGTEAIRVFTTRPDTLDGVTFLILAPEHPLVDIVTQPAQKAKMAAYRKEVASKGDLERTDLAREKSGVWTGSYALHPTNGSQIPIWVADYVLLGYGTGAIMGVPAMDERDAEFAAMFSLPIISLPELPSSASVIAKLETSKKGERCTTYKLRDWLFSRQRYWGEPFPILHFPDGSQRVLDIDELPLVPPELTDFRPSSTGESPLAKVPSWVNITDPKTGKPARRETNTMPQWAGSCWYYLRFCDPHNDKAAWDPAQESYWMPVDLYVGGVEHAVLHLLYARFWHKVLFDCGLVSTNEPFQKLRNQGLITARSYKLPSGLYVPETDVVSRGGEFVSKETDTPLTTQIEKMSKSKLNGITPDEIILEFGADALRLYEMFMGPFDQEKLWNRDAIHGCSRFLSRMYALVTSSKVSDTSDPEALKLSHRLVFAVEHDIETLSFNTAIAKMMEFINHFSALSSYPKEALQMAISVLYPFAPHLAEELHQILGGRESLVYTPFPTPDPRYLTDATTLYIVQVNGKLRGKWDLPKGKTADELLAFIQTQPQIARHVVGEIDKVVYVPDKLINIVLK